MERGAWSVERGAWSVERGAFKSKNLGPVTGKHQTSDTRPKKALGIIIHTTTIHRNACS